MRVAIVARELDHASVGREVAAQHRDPTVVAERRIGGADHLLARGLGRRGGDLGDRPAVDGPGVAVQQAELEQPLHEHAEPARGEQIGRDEAAAGPEVGEDRRPRADGVEVVDLER